MRDLGSVGSFSWTAETYVSLYSLKEEIVKNRKVRIKFRKRFNNKDLLRNFFDLFTKQPPFPSSCGGRGNYAKIQNSCEFQVKNLLFQSMKSNLLVSGHESDSLLSAFAGVR